MRINFLPKQLFTVATLILANNVALAGNAVTPDAGQILNEIERNEKFLFPDADSQQNIKPKTEKEADDTPRIEVKSFSFTGNQELTGEQINEFLNNFVGKSVTVSELQSIAFKLADFYRYNGFIALVTLPDQDVTAGSVQLNIQEATYGGTDITTENGQSKVKESLISKIMGFRMQDKKLNLKEVDRRILLINDLPGITAQSSLAPGENEGETKVNLVVKNSKPFVGSGIVLDNYGSRATGRARAVANLNINSPFGIGDQIRLTALKSEGVNYGRFDYALPVGASGLTMGANLSYLEYDVIPDEFKSTDPNGYSTILGLTANYPWIRSQDLNLNAFAEFDNRSFKNKNNTGTQSDYDVQALSLGFRGNFIDALALSGAINRYEFSLTSGDVDLGGSPNKDSDAAGANTQDGFTKLYANLSREQYINSEWSLYGRLITQWADRNLDSSEKIYLGGPNGVRAYPVSEGAGSQGYIANFEIRRALPQNLTLTGFYDIGHAKQYVTNYPTVNADPNGYTLKGYGLSLAWNGPQNSYFSVAVAKRIGENPNRTSTDKDLDGSHKDNFMWVRGGITF